MKGDYIPLENVEVINKPSFRITKSVLPNTILVFDNKSKRYLGSVYRRPDGSVNVSECLLEYVNNWNYAA